MRNLIINREHSDIAAKDTYLVYIEDHAVPECKIDGVWVRKLGTIRDGETARFRIADREALLFVVKNKITRNYSNSCYHIDEGVGGDVFVSGKCEKNVLKFNPFKFDGDTSYEVEEFKAKVRKKKTAWFIGILAAFVMISYIAMSGMLASWVDPNRDVYQPSGWSDDAAAKDLGDPNFTVTLNDNFTANFNHTSCMRNRLSVIWVNKRNFTILSTVIFSNPHTLFIHYTNLNIMLTHFFINPKIGSTTTLSLKFVSYNSIANITSNFL